MFLKIGCIGCHETQKRQNDVSFNQMVDVYVNAGYFLGKTEFIKTLAPESVQEKESNMSLWIG